MSDRIVIDPTIQHGKPVIRGTRAPVVCILGGLVGGMSIDEVTQEYGITVEEVRAVLVYASEVIGKEVYSHARVSNP